MPEGVVGVAHAVNPGVAEASAGLEQSLLFGRDRFAERIGGLEFAVTAGAFMQTNTVMAERLYALAIESPTCGPATWSGISTAAPGRSAFWRRRSAERVYGIEISEESIAGARENAERNGIANVEFVAGDVAKSVAPAARARAPARRGLRRPAPLGPHAEGA